MSNNSIAVIIRYQSQPGMEDVTKKELASLIATVVAEEEACLSIDLHQDMSDPSRFLLYEIWTDRESYLGDHMQTPHIQSFIQRAGEFIAGPPEKSFWHLCDKL